jgi:hypothetical protein
MRALSTIRALTSETIPLVRAFGGVDCLLRQ